MAPGGGWGQRLDSQKGLDLKGLEGFSGAVQARAARRYPTQGTGHGERGGTVGAGLEGYIANNSQWSRWRRGMGLALGAIQGGRLMQEELLATFRSSGALEPRSLKLTFSFPASERELSWLTVVRPRGSLLGLAPLQASELELEAGWENPEEWRLWYSPPGSAAVVSANLRFFQHFIGEFFEDSARPGLAEEPYFERLIESDSPAKLMLVEVDLAKGRLGFRVNRWRQMERRSSGPVEVTKEASRVEDLPRWRPGRVICSSHKFSCSCPDFLGRSYADLEGETTGRAISNRFPLPSASRSMGAGGPQDGSVEARQAGNYRQWRTVASEKIDLWACKHVHAVRWLCGCPLTEPGDVPPGPDFRALREGLETEQAQLEASLRSGQPGRRGRAPSGEAIHRELYTRRNPDAEAAALAVSTGILIEPPTNAYENVRPFDKWGYRSMLWEAGKEPDPVWCRQNDWWSPTGVFDVFRFDTTTSSFRQNGGAQTARTFEGSEGLRKAIVRYSMYRGPEDNPALQLLYQQDERYRLKFKPVIVR